MVTNRLVKGHLLQCKRASFTHQKGMFYHAKGRLLQCKRCPFKIQLRISFTKIGGIESFESPRGKRVKWVRGRGEGYVEEEKRTMKKTKEMRGECAKVADEFVIDSLISPYF